MNGATYLFLEPIDVLFLRGNQAYGDPGCYGESYMPPWPSVVAGAIRSRMLVDGRVDLEAYAENRINHLELGTPESPGPFTLSVFTLARRSSSGRIEILVPPPKDIVITKQPGQACRITAMQPVKLPETGARLSSSYRLPFYPVLAEQERSKPAGGFWFSERAFIKYLTGKIPQPEDLVETREIWKTDARVGVGLNPATRSAVEGRLFSTEAIVMTKRKLDGSGFDAGFLVAVTGGKPPSNGPLRFGGDGRAVAIREAESFTMPEPDYEQIASAGCLRLVLATPGIFKRGWLPNGFYEAQTGEYRFDLCGVKGRLAAACVPRAETVSGWDLARRLPKPAQRAVPAGSVYWLDEVEASAGDLRRLAEAGLWSDSCEDPARRAEGFNRIWLAEWKKV